MHKDSDDKLNNYRDFIPLAEFDEILDAIHDDILIVDSQGLITHVSNTIPTGIKK